jgi:arylsulfatase A-like enzyme
LAEVDLTKTTVIFIGDNGTPQNVIQPPYTAAHSKGTLYEGGTRVPLIIAGKGVASPNRSSAVPVHSVDLYATVLELAGINVAATQPVGQAIDSHSVMPVLANTADTPRHAFFQQFGADLTTAQSGQAIVDAAGYKLIQFDDGHEEFYKTGTDLNETTTLLGNVALSAADQAAYAALKLEMAEVRGGRHAGRAFVDKLVHPRLRPVCAAVPDAGGHEQRQRGQHLEPGCRSAGVADLQRGASDRLLQPVGLHPQHRLAGACDGAVVFECAEDQPLPELPV